MELYLNQSSLKIIDVSQALKIKLLVKATIINPLKLEERKKFNPLTKKISPKDI